MASVQAFYDKGLVSWLTGLYWVNWIYCMHFVHSGAFNEVILFTWNHELDVIGFILPTRPVILVYLYSNKVIDLLVLLEDPIYIPFYQNEMSKLKLTTVYGYPEVLTLKFLCDFHPDYQGALTSSKTLRMDLSLHGIWFEWSHPISTTIISDSLIFLPLRGT